jgi:putative acetyltransferase
MEIRRFKDGEEEEIWKLFYNTIHNVNIYDYNKNQIDAWAPKDFDINLAIKKFREIRPFVVILEGQIVGYADIQADGYIDHFFCHHEFQGQGVGRMLFSTLEMEAKDNGILTMYSNVSITARSFFEGMGFSVEKEQLVPIRGQELKNYRMVRQHEHS